MDFLWYNIYGFACYTSFNLAFFTSEEIRKEYRDRNNGKDNLVQINDVGFALHALILSTITLIQSFVYKVCHVTLSFICHLLIYFFTLQRDSYQRISPVAFSLIVMSLLCAFSLFMGVLF